MSSPSCTRQDCISFRFPTCPVEKDFRCLFSASFFVSCIFFPYVFSHCATRPNYLTPCPTRTRMFVSRAVARRPHSGMENECHGIRVAPYPEPTPIAICYDGFGKSGESGSGLKYVFDVKHLARVPPKGLLRLLHLNSYSFLMYFFRSGCRACFVDLT